MAIDSEPEPNPEGAPAPEELVVEPIAASATETCAGAVPVRPQQTAATGFENEGVDEADGDEPTQVTPEALMELLRQASRADEPLLTYEASHEDETRLIVMGQAPPPLNVLWLRRAAPLTGAVLTALLALPADHYATVAAHAEAARDAMPDAPRNRGLVEVTQLTDDTLSTFSSDTHSTPVAQPPMSPIDQAQGQEALEVKWERALKRGQAQLADQDLDAAALSFERAIGYKPSDVHGYAGLGSVELARERWHHAVWALRKATELSPDDAALHTELGKAYEQAGRTTMAEKAYLRARELNPAP